MVSNASFCCERVTPSERSERSAARSSAASTVRRPREDAFETSRTQRVDDAPRARGAHTRRSVFPEHRRWTRWAPARRRRVAPTVLGRCACTSRVADQFRTLQLVYDERFAPTYGAWRAVVPEVADKFLACGVLEHGFARVHCDACAHEYLLAFSCKARYFCPSCHAKRLALWTLWLEETLLASVPHRQVVLTIPKRLRTWCLYRRALLGDLARVAARTVTDAVRMLRASAISRVGVVACIQTHGSLANWHPHIHPLVTDGGFRADGMSFPWPAHDTAGLTEAFRRAVLRLFVRRGLFEADDAQGMLAWPHSGFHVHDGVWVPDGDMDFAKRLARYCARNPPRGGPRAARSPVQPARSIRTPPGAWPGPLACATRGAAQRGSRRTSP